jgi:hypothetical protein
VAVDVTVAIDVAVAGIAVAGQFALDYVHLKCKKNCWRGLAKTITQPKILCQLQ